MTTTIGTFPQVLSLASLNRPDRPLSRWMIICKPTNLHGLPSFAFDHCLKLSPDANTIALEKRAT